MPLLPDNVSVATHLTSNIAVGVRISTNSTVSLTSGAEHTATVSIPAVVGGTAAGVALAVIAVMGWKWWPSIIRHTNKPRKRNVLRRDRTTSTKLNQELPGSTMDGNSPESSDWKQDLADSPLNTISPHPTTPRQHPLVTAAPALPGPPTKPPRNPARTLRRPSKEIAVRGSRTSFLRASNALSYKSSNLSTSSEYSTQSGEEQQVRVPAAVIVAALGHTFGTRRLPTLNPNSEPYTIGEEEAEFAIPRPRLWDPTRGDGVGHLHRVSNISAGSLSLQGSQSIASIGVAYGGEECEEPFHEKRFTAEGLDIAGGSVDHEIARPDGHSVSLH